MAEKTKKNPEEEIVWEEINSDINNVVRNYILSNCTGRNIPLKHFINEIEKEMICKALRVSGGNQKIASFILGVKPTTMSEKIKKFNLCGTEKIKEKRDLKNLINKINLSAL